MVKWTNEGLVPAIAKDAQDGTSLMVARMSREALDMTARKGKAVYGSRSGRKLWLKGEESGHEQLVGEIRRDCLPYRASELFFSASGARPPGLGRTGVEAPVPVPGQLP